jgi:periplasmic protein TonB
MIAAKMNLAETILRDAGCLKHDLIERGVLTLRDRLQGVRREVVNTRAEAGQNLLAGDIEPVGDDVDPDREIGIRRLVRLCWRVASRSGSRRYGRDGGKQRGKDQHADGFHRHFLFSGGHGGARLLAMARYNVTYSGSRQAEAPAEGWAHVLPVGSRGVPASRPRSGWRGALGGSAVVHVGLALALLVVIRRVEHLDVPMSQSVAVEFASPAPAVASLPLDRHDAEAAVTPAAPTPMPVPQSQPTPAVPPSPPTPPPQELAPSSPAVVAPPEPPEASTPAELPLPPRAPSAPPVRLRSAASRVSRPQASAAPPTVTSEGTQAAAQPAQASVAARPTAAVVAGWREALGAWLAAHKTYPEDARRRGEEGRAAVHFTMDRSGRVLDVELSQSSGSAILDEAARAMLRGATLPPLPPTMTQEQITVTVTIRYALAP